jgi:glycosyltransferase involved in cell wall biosynthesis
MESGAPSHRPVVLHVLEAVQAGGGTARHLIDVVGSTPGVVHEVAVPATRPGWPADPAALAALRTVAARVHIVDMRRVPAHPANARALAHLRRLIAARAPAIVHGHSSVGGALARLAATRSHVVSIYTPNGIAAGRLTAAVERWLGRRTDVLVAVSPSEAELAHALGIVPRLGIEIVPNGVALELPPAGADLRALAGVPADAPLVGCVARLQPQKNPLALVEAAARITAQRPDVHILLIGEGPLAGDVDAAALRAGLGARWHRIDHVADLAGSLGQLDVLVSCSRFEGAPYAPLEAMRAGTPVVLTDVVGNRDVVEDGQSGLLAPGGDTAALAKGVLSLLADDELRARVVDAGRRRVRDHFDVRAQGEALARVYQRALSTRR